MLIVAIVLGLVFLVVLLLSVPIDLSFSYEKGEDSRSRMRVGWLFGLIGKELGGETKARERKPKKRKPKKGWRSFRGPLAMFRARGFSGGLLLLIRRMVRSARVRNVDIDFQVGTGDPAEMGLLYAAIGPSVALARSGFSPNIMIEPNFVEETFEGHARGAVRIYPVKLLPSLIAFALSPATFRGLRAMRRGRQR